MPNIEWRRPSGTLITTNDSPDAVAAAQSLGWVRSSAGPDSPPVQGKKGKRQYTKVEDDGEPF
jgi:hypothetical protein